MALLSARESVERGEQRVQQSLVEMLSGRLAQKEKENELSRRQQQTTEMEMARLRERTSEAEAQWADKEQSLRREIEALRQQLEAKVKQSDRVQ